LLDEITDCKIIRGDDGRSRKFAFVGFKDKNSSELAKKKYNNTYLGASKIMVDIARLKGEEDPNERSRTR
jgi:multiple RNA-binding domain-containing protein 1